MYRYLVFGYDGYYPRGGMHDCIEKTNDLSKVKEIFTHNRKYEYLEFYDCATGETYKSIDALERE